MDDSFLHRRGNLPELSVSELSQEIKSTLGRAFDRVRVRGEITKLTDHRSGHLYLTLTENDAALDALCWRSSRSRLSIKPEDGMEVICTGSVSAYAPRSRYQLVIEQMELAGEGALLKLLEDRRRRLRDEGLFDQDRKQPLPDMPQVIGVITSPTGSVIRDILHRLNDRFPVHVLVWPVQVQGTGAKEQIAAAIEGFNALKDGPVGALPRPDLLIVARGGGSLEDLWPFNEEEVVQAAAASSIPLISAVGHETDTTLIDLAADRRAPTPTAAAEFAVPIRSELLAQVNSNDLRLFNAVTRQIAEQRTGLSGLARGLGDPHSVIETRAQTVDYLEQRLAASLQQRLDQQALVMARLADRLPRPEVKLAETGGVLAVFGQRLLNAGTARIERSLAGFDRVAVRVRFEPLSRRLEQADNGLVAVARQLRHAAGRRLAEAVNQLAGLVRLLRSGSYERILERGFVLARDQSGTAISRLTDTRPGQKISLRFSDGETGAVIGGAPRRRKSPDPVPEDDQGSLF